MTFTKEQLIDQARENVRALKMAAVQSAFKEVRPAIELDLNLAEIALAALESRADAEPVSGTQFRAVADLYSIAVPGGRSVTYSTDAAEASDYRAMGWAVQEFVKLERYQDAIVGNAPLIPDGYALVPVEPTIAMLDEFDSIIDYGADDSNDAWSRLLAAACIKSLSAAPQQEVKP